jgi:hypothetical protein
MELNPDHSGLNWLTSNQEGMWPGTNRTADTKPENQTHQGIWLLIPVSPLRPYVKIGIADPEIDCHPSCTVSFKNIGRPRIRKRIRLAAMPQFDRQRASEVLTSNKNTTTSRTRIGRLYSFETTALQPTKPSRAPGRSCRLIWRLFRSNRAACPYKRTASCRHHV